MRAGKTPLFNVLLKKFKATTGGHLKACLSGGGAISAEVQEWVRTALDAPLVQGYGLTETTGGATIQMPDDKSIVCATPAPLRYPCATSALPLRQMPDDKSIICTRRWLQPTSPHAHSGG